MRIIGMKVNITLLGETQTLQLFTCFCKWQCKEVFYCVLVTEDVFSSATKYVKMAEHLRNQLHYLWICIHRNSQNPILHNNKSLTKPCDHFVVYLYRNLEKLNHTDTSYMLIPFMFWGCAQKTFFISTNTDAMGIHFIDLLSGLDQHGPLRRHGTQQHRWWRVSRAQVDQQMKTHTVENTELNLIPHSAGTTGTSCKSSVLCSPGSHYQKISSWLIDIILIWLIL